MNSSDSFSFLSLSSSTSLLSSDELNDHMPLQENIDLVENFFSRAAITKVKATRGRQRKPFLVNHSAPRIQKRRIISVITPFLHNTAQIRVELRNMTNKRTPITCVPVVAFDKNLLGDRYHGPIYSGRLEEGRQHKVYFYLATNPVPGRSRTPQNGNDDYCIIISLQYENETQEIHQFTFTPIKTHNFESTDIGIQQNALQAVPVITYLG